MLTCAPRVPSRKSRLREDGLAVAREAERQPPLHAVEEERLLAVGAVRRAAPRGPAAAARRSRARRGSRGRARPATPCAGRTPRSIRKTSESNFAPSWRARTRSTTPKRRTERAVGQRRVRPRRRRRAGGTGPRPPPPRTRAAARPACRGRGPTRAHATACACRCDSIARRTISGSPSRWRSRLSSPPIGQRFCGARGSCAGSDAKRGQQAGATASARARAASRPSSAAVSSRTTPVSGISIARPCAMRSVPGVARVRVVRDQEERRPLAHREARQERRRVGGQVRAEQPLHEPDDRSARAGRERQRPVQEDEAAALGDLGGQDGLGPAHRVLQPLHRRQRRVLRDRVSLEEQRHPAALARHLERRQDEPSADAGDAGHDLVHDRRLHVRRAGADRERPQQAEPGAAVTADPQPMVDAPHAVHEAGRPERRSRRRPHRAPVGLLDPQVDPGLGLLGLGQQERRVVLGRPRVERDAEAAVDHRASLCRAAAAAGPILTAPGSAGSLPPSSAAPDPTWPRATARERQQRPRGRCARGPSPTTAAPRLRDRAAP